MRSSVGLVDIGGGEGKWERRAVVVVVVVVERKKGE